MKKAMKKPVVALGAVAACMSAAMAAEYTLEKSGVRAASGTVSVDGMAPVGGDARVSLPANGITVLEFVRR